jgi:hypothetical protein
MGSTPLVTWTGWNFRPASRWVESVFPQVSTGGVWNFRSKQKDEWLVPMLDLSLIKQTAVHVEQLWSAENYRGVQFDGIRRTSVNVSCNPVNAAQFGAEAHWAHTIRRTENPFLGEQLSLEAWATLRLGQRTVITPSLEWVRMEHPNTHAEVFRGYVARTRLSLQLTRELFLRTIVQYDDFDGIYDIEPLLSYKVNPFTVLYLGSTHRFVDYGEPHDYEQAARQFFLKAQVLFQSQQGGLVHRATAASPRAGQGSGSLGSSPAARAGQRRVAGQRREQGGGLGGEPYRPGPPRAVVVAARRQHAAAGPHQFHRSPSAPTAIVLRAVAPGRRSARLAGLGDHVLRAGPASGALSRVRASGPQAPVS